MCAYLTILPMFPVVHGKAWLKGQDEQYTKRSPASRDKCHKEERLAQQFHNI
jgi:hypothetical protein